MFQTPGCSCVAFHFSSSSSCNGGEGGQLFLPPGGGGLLQVQVGSLANHSAGFSPASAAAHNTAAGCFNNATRQVKQRAIRCNFNSSNIQCVERIPYQRLFSFAHILWRLAYLLYGSVASLLSPSSNIEAWSYGTSLRSCI